MILVEYLTKNKIDRGEFAAGIGVTRAALNFWISGVRTPRQEQMQAIVAATHGAVTPNDFLPREATP